MFDLDLRCELREIRGLLHLTLNKLDEQEKKMALVDDAVKALTPKLQSVDTEIGLVLSTMATNQAATAQAIQDALNKGASPETLAAIKTASDKADADLLAMQTALATPPPA